MRIHNVYIAGFKNLRDLTVEFDSSEPISVVVGRNGSGKSNLIEALTIIFRDLDLSRGTDFEYQIGYEVRGFDVVVENVPARNPRRKIRVDGRRASLSDLNGSKDNIRRLPDFVFGYYSGPTNRLQKHFEHHQTVYNRALREGADLPLRRLFYAQPAHSQFVLMAFFLARDSSELSTSFLREHLRIDGFDSALFVLRQPDWKATGGDPRFWNARGAVANLLSELYELSLAPMRLESGPVQPGARRGKEQIYLYLPSLGSLERLAAKYGNSPQQLFAAFESILAADLLGDLRLRVKALGMDGSLTFRELSEGEQQLLMVLGLLRFTQENESLFLLDEPDTHLNPAWGLRYTQLLLEHSGNGIQSGHIIMASHDPLVVASLLARQVILLERDNLSGVVIASNPDMDPRGMGVSALLTSEIYGLASELDPITYDKLEKRRWLASADSLSEDEERELLILTEELKDLDFTLSDRDPLYTEFEQAMREVSRQRQLDVTPSAKRAEKDAALSRLRQILHQDSPTHGAAADDSHVGGEDALG